MSETLDSSERFVELSHGRTRYFDVGAGAPTILIHGVGYTAGGTSWYRNIDALSAGMRVLAVDCVGWGTGDRLKQGYSFAYLVDFIREFQDALGLTSSNIVGHSMGGWLASLFSYESPERVDRLVLTAAGGVLTRTLAQMTEFVPPSRADVLARITALAGITVEDAEDWTTYEWANVQGPESLASYRRILEHMSNPETRLRYNTVRRLPHIAAETLVVWGTNDDVNVPELGERIASLVPNARLETIDCGHMVPHESPKEFNDVLLSFLG